MAEFKIAVLPGDGIGKEVVREAVRVLQAIGDKFGHKFHFKEALVGGSAYDETGVPLPAETMEICEKSDAILLGAVGGDKWDNLPPHLRPEAALLTLRKNFDFFANLRPVILFPPLIDASPLKKNVLKGTDMIIVRELTGGLYFGKPKERRKLDGEWVAVDSMVYSESEIIRIAQVAFKIAMNRRRIVHSVDKANILETSRLWREVVNEVAKDYQEVKLYHFYVDNAAMQMIRNPRQFDVILTENTFGDILSDEAAMLTGSIGMLPSASIRGDGFGMYEPVHGSAPDIAGKGIANPIATILSSAMMLRFSFQLEEEAKAIENAVLRVLEKGFRTPDIMSKGKILLSTQEMGEKIVEELERKDG
ncbi:3-isopropylmalate dehydrogenase [bacterium]|nr:3-isopropylmalate dehydrogenase [bacterium]